MCLCVCTNWSAPIPLQTLVVLAAFQTLPEEPSEPFRCLRRIWENEAVNKSQSSQHLFLNSEVSAVFPKISLCQQSIPLQCTCRVKDFERFHMNTERVSVPTFHGKRVDNYEFYFCFCLE